MTSAYDDKEFIEAVIPGDLLEDAITWIKKNLNPEDVFPVEDLNEWAEDAGYTMEE